MLQRSWGWEPPCSSWIISDKTSGTPHSASCSFRTSGTTSQASGSGLPTFCSGAASWSRTGMLRHSGRPGDTIPPGQQAGFTPDLLSPIPEHGGTPVLPQTPGPKPMVSFHLGLSKCPLASSPRWPAPLLHPALALSDAPDPPGSNPNPNFCLALVAAISCQFSEKPTSPTCSCPAALSLPPHSYLPCGPIPT